MFGSGRIGPWGRKKKIKALKDQEYTKDHPTASNILRTSTFISKVDDECLEYWAVVSFGLFIASLLITQHKRWKLKIKTVRRGTRGHSENKEMKNQKRLTDNAPLQDYLPWVISFWILLSYFSMCTFLSLSLSNDNSITLEAGLGSRERNRIL